VGVVEIEAVAEGAVEQGGAGRGVAGTVAEHRRAAGGKPEGAGGGEQRRRAFGVVAAAQHVADEVEHEEARAGADGFRESAEVEAGGVFGENFCYLGHGRVPPHDFWANCDAARVAREGGVAAGGERGFGQIPGEGLALVGCGRRKRGIGAGCADKSAVPRTLRAAGIRARGEGARHSDKMASVTWRAGPGWRRRRWLGGTGVSLHPRNLGRYP